MRRNLNRNAGGSPARLQTTTNLADKLNTGHADDTAFNPSRSYKLAVDVHNDTGDMDKASGVAELSFGT